MRIALKSLSSQIRFSILLALSLPFGSLWAAEGEVGEVFDWEVERKHWAYQAIAPGATAEAPLETAAELWIRRPLDRLV